MKFYLIPKEGVTVRDPQTGKALAEAGETKPRSSYWLRRLRDGDVVEGKEPPKVAKPPKPAKPAVKAADASTTDTTSNAGKGDAK